LSRLAEPEQWPTALTDRLEVLGNIFANALMRKQAQEARQESEERFRYLFAEAPIGIALEDLEGRVLFANPALCSMLGYTPEELTSMNCSQFAYPEDEEEDWREFQAMRAGTRRSYQLEKRYRRKDGSRMWGRLNVSMLNSSGRPDPGACDRRGHYGENGCA
jgi:PAS domain S-box-containing protein